MLWCFIALQAMAPFIHAHAGATSLSHDGPLHLHEDAPHADAAGCAATTGEHGTEVSVASGLRLRDVSGIAMAPMRAPMAIALRLAPAPHAFAWPPAPPSLRLSLPDHTLPHVLAPPAA